jgi:predicted RNase H-like nuclease (RuvC/YqgF family)
MQKNIVFGVNAALAAEAPAKNKKSTVNPIGNDNLKTIKEELEILREENAQFVTAMEEVRAQNQELREKLDQLISNSTKKNNKKKGSSKKSS